MTTRAFYRAAVLLPFVGLAIAAALERPSGELPPGWEWVYPTSLARGVLVYALLAAGLWARLRHRPTEAIERVLWWIPLVYVAMSGLLMLALALPRGRAGEFWPEQAGAILMRLCVHLAVGYGYVALVIVTRNLMRAGGTITDAP